MKIKTICFWCGKSHRTNKPKKCKDASILMSKICKKLPVWQAMHVVERYGILGLELLKTEFKIK
jgi:hypothetical protein